MSVETEAAERDSNVIIEQQLSERLGVVEDAAGGDVVAYFGSIFPPGDDELKDVVESIPPPRQTQPKRRTLFVSSKPRAATSRPLRGWPRSSDTTIGASSSSFRATRCLPAPSW